MKFTFMCKEPISHVNKRVAVIGAGPAGLTITGYLACRGYEVDVYEKLPYPGGLMVFAIPRHRISLDEVFDAWKDLEINFGVKFFFKTKVSIGTSVDEGDEFVETRVGLLELTKKYDGVIIATGTWRSRRLDIEGENAKNVVSALSFLYRRRLKELGLFSGESESKFNRVIVIGAGLSAVDAVEECFSMGVKEVYLVYRRSIKEAPAGAYKIRELINRGAKWIELAQPKRIIVEDGYAKAVEFVKVSLGELDESRRPRPIPIPGTEFVIEADLVIEAVGETPSPPIYSGDLLKYIDPSGRIVIDSNYRIPGTNIFAVGDVVVGPSKIGLAIDHALNAIKIIDEVLTKEKISIPTLISKLKPIEKPMVKRLEWEESLGEKICKFLDSYGIFKFEKCLNATPFIKIIDYSKCIGCETCSAICKFLHEGKSLIKINKTEDGLVYPTTCLHCTNPECQAVCKRNAIIHGDLGEVLIDYKKCNNCLDCLTACPVKAIRLSRGQIIHCDLCLSLQKAGLEPACLSMCPSKAIMLMYIKHH